MQKLYQALTMGSLLLLFYSCNKNNSPSTIAQSPSYSENTQQPNTVTDALKSDRFLVPPEIAIMQANIRATNKSFTKTFELIETNTDRVIQSINNTDGCRADILNYQHSEEASSNRDYGFKNFDDLIYTSSLDLEITISFDNNNSVKERIQQLNNCIQAVPQLTSDDSENGSISLNLSQPIPTVKNASEYRKQLLGTKFASLQEVANLSETPSQFNASDTKCTSKGNIQIINRSLSNIELDIDFNCQQFGNSSKS